MASRDGLKMKLIFPASYLSSQLSMTGLLIAVGLGGNPQLAADIGIVQGAALALFFTFSGNARNLIFKSRSSVSTRSLLTVRLMLVLPLGAGAYYLGSVLGGVAWDIAFVLILRKSVEWLSEIHLSEIERDQNATFAWRHMLLQSGLLLAAVIWAVADLPGLIPILAAWAIFPFSASLPHLIGVFAAKRSASVPARMLVPHLGSTAVMGIGVYVFRLALLLLVGKVTAGDLFTAFAIGGAFGSVFAAGLGPSLVLHEQQTGQRHMPPWLRNVLALAGCAGVVIAAMAYLLPDWGMLLGKVPLFWQAVGLSLVGGVVMVLAQQQRLRDLQNSTEDDVFAPDVLVNILIIAIVPFVYFVLGMNGLPWLYLFNAAIALVFYWMMNSKRAEVIVRAASVVKLRVLLAILLVVPIFVNLETGLFRSPSLAFDSGGVLNRLPIPISVFACFAGIALLGNYRRAKLGLGIIFASFALMALSTVATAYNHPAEQQAKLVLLVQYLLPMFGLVLGMMYEQPPWNDHLLEKVLLSVIAVLAPAQLIATWVQGHMMLTPYLYLFSIYQHLQYVPVILVGGYLVSLFTLWDQPVWRRLITVITPVVAIYVMASASLLAAGLMFTGFATFLVCRSVWGDRLAASIPAWKTGILAFLAATAYRLIEMNPDLTPGWTRAGDQYENTKVIFLGKAENVTDRIDYWSFYLRQILIDPSTFLFGHSTPPDRSVLPSAHNYYLDYMYNYGFIASLVIVGLVVFTAIRIYRNREIIVSTSSLFGLALVALFLLVPDSLLKVGMRQPYPGIFAFFLWGLLLARLESLRGRMPRGAMKSDASRIVRSGSK